MDYVKDRLLLRTLRLIVLCTGTMVLESILQVNPVLAQSTYQNSCRDINIAGDTLSASCRRIDGSFNNTVIKIQGIENIDGFLEFRGLGRASTYQNSCRGINVSGDTLSASCRRINGSFINTVIKIPGIDNINGNLTY